jgi:hypothetical protein
MKFVTNWRKAGKWWSTWAHSANTTFLLAWAALPDKFQDALPTWALIGIAVGLLVTGMFFRMVDQGTAE